MKNIISVNEMYIIWIALLAIICLMWELVTTFLFWILKHIFSKRKCKECYGDRKVYFDGEDLWLDCEHCKGSGFKN